MMLCLVANPYDVVNVSLQLALYHIVDMVRFKGLSHKIYYPLTGPFHPFHQIIHGASHPVLQNCPIVQNSQGSKELNK